MQYNVRLLIGGYALAFAFPNLYSSATTYIYANADADTNTVTDTNPDSYADPHTCIHPLASPNPVSDPDTGSFIHAITDTDLNANF